jgi:hypothetical protein
VKQKLLLLALLGAVLLNAALVIADDGFYVIAGGGKPLGKEIAPLPFTISQSGTYYLTRNLTATGNGIIISANNVTLDLMGFTLTGPGTTGNSAIGIQDTGDFGVEIRNGCITNFGGDGIRFTGTNSRLIGLRVSNVGGAGISEGGKNQVIACIASNCGHEGIWSGGLSMLKGNTVRDNAYTGIRADTYSTVAGNVGSGNPQGDILITGKFCTVIDNTTVQLLATDFCTIARNSTFYFQSGDYCTITNNTSAGPVFTVIGNNCVLDNNRF